MAKKKKKKGRNNDSDLIQSVVDDFESDYIGVFTGDNAIDMVEEWIPSKNHALNYALGDPRKGAIAQGKITEFFGPKSSAKSLILYDLGIQLQHRLDGIFILIDSEASFTKSFGKYLGVDFNKFVYAQLVAIEEIFDFIIGMIKKLRAKTSKPILFGLDSIAASSTLKSLEDPLATSEMGERARLMGKYMRDVTGLLMRENVTLLGVNQIRKKLGVMFGNPETTPGGEAFGYHSSQRMEVRKAKKITKTSNGTSRIIGHKLGVYVEKNRVRPPFARTTINVYVDRVSKRYGLDEYSGLIDLLLADGIARKSGKKFVLVDNDSVEFTEKTIHKYWTKEILPSIPEDLYVNPSSNFDDSGDENEED